ncbi:hypothetical protein HMPREF0682_0142 [Propionibacterium acidifaciens F0233]|uniref:Uncharacterized protein n=1 Tax=Propionibacterium acidifaciens F0233 TaxID=553198 RepID=U2Q127_9ACTN|nr:hypothetical protein HMPREF0682_0142 [Propionibacterium acidifaciens F0233]
MAGARASVRAPRLRRPAARAPRRVGSQQEPAVETGESTVHGTAHRRPPQIRGPRPPHGPAIRVPGAPPKARNGAGGARDGTDGARDGTDDRPAPLVPLTASHPTSVLAPHLTSPLPPHLCVGTSGTTRVSTRK